MSSASQMPDFIETHDWHRAVIDVMTEGVVLQDATGRVRAINRSAERIIGRTAGELNGRDTVDMNSHTFREDGSPVPLAAMPSNATLRDGVARTNVILRVERPDGNQLWLSINTQPLRGENGEMRGVVSTFIDISAQKRAEQRQRLDAELLARSQRIARLGSFVWSPRTNDLRWSDETFRIFGVPRSTEPSLELYKSGLHPDDIERVLASIRRTLDEGTPHVFDHRVVRPDGTIRFVHCEGVVEFRDGAPELLIGTVQDVTERALAEEQRAKNERQLRDVQAGIEAVSDGIFWVEPDGRIARVNTAAATRLGYTPEEIVGLGIWDINPQFTREYWQGHWEALRARGSITIETTHLRRDGHRVPVEVVANHVSFEGREVNVALVRDITQRQQAEQELRSTAGRLARAQQVGRMGDWSVDLTADRPTWSEEVFRLVGRDPAEGPPTRAELDAMMEPASAARVTEAMRLCVEGLEQTIEVTMRPQFGGRLLEVMLVPMRDAAGQVRGAYGTVHDVTDERRVLEELRRATDRLRRAQTIAGVGDWTMDLETGRVTWSEETYRIFRRDPSLPPPTLDEFLSWFGLRSRIKILRAAKRTLLDREEPVAELTMERLGERPVHLQATIAPDRAECGTVRAFFGVVQDVTSRREDAEERQRLLERERRARTDAEQANRAKDLFLATLSHELRTPMTTILTWAQMLRRGTPSPAKVSQGLDRIERAALAQKQLISDLLDVSRIVAGKLDFSPEALDPEHAVHAALEAVRPAALEKSIHLELELSAPGARVRADPMRLQQVLWNLATNAVKFTPSGGEVRVTVDRLTADPVRPHGALRIAVRDTGCGIDPAFVPYVFDRFSQADASSTRGHGGLGLGLAIARHLVQLHDGTLRVESDGVGLGSTFTVELPLCDLRPARDESPLRPSTLRGLRRLDDLRVLLVEDEDGAREAFAEVLREAGADVATAASADEATTLLDDGRFDLLVSDIAMPGQDGNEFVRRIRERTDDKREMPALALTAYATREDARRALGAGFDAHLAKPVDAGLLIATVGTLARLAVRREEPIAAE